MKEFLKANEKRLRVEFLPPYAPELNPREYVCVVGRKTIWLIFVQRILELVPKPIYGTFN